jgi:hypothetical protein
VIVVDTKIEEELWNLNGTDYSKTDYLLSLSGVGEIDINKCGCYNNKNKALSKCIRDCNFAYNYNDFSDNQPVGFASKINDPSSVCFDGSKQRFYLDTDGCVRVCVASADKTAYISYEDLQKYTNLILNNYG